MTSHPQSICGALYSKEIQMKSQTGNATRMKSRRSAITILMPTRGDTKLVEGLPWYALCAALALLLSLAAAQGSAQTLTQTPTPMPTPMPTATPPDLESIVKVKDVYNFRSHTYYDHKLWTEDVKGLIAADHDNEDTRKAGLNERIVIAVVNLQALLKRSNCEAPYDEKYQKPCVKQPIVLFLDGRVVKGLKPEIVETLPIPTSTYAQSSDGKDGAQAPKQFGDGFLSFHLRRAADLTADRKDNLENWADLLGLALGDLDAIHEVKVSVGLADGSPILIDGESQIRLSLVRFSKFWMAIFITFFLLCVLTLVWLAWKKELLCDRAPVLWPNKMPFSLGSVQAAWWFVIILGSFIFIWLVTGQYDYSATAIILLSISLGTALGGSIIDINKQGTPADNNVNGNDLDLLLAEKRRFDKGLKDLWDSEAKLEEKKAKTDEMMKDYNKLIRDLTQKFPSAIGHHREGFFIDILSDANGVSFHRFQMAIWTLVLGAFFIISVLSHLEMPEFNTTLLALMGISATAYLGFKIPEDARAPAHAPPTPQPDQAPQLPPPTPAPQLPPPGGA